MAVTKNSVNNKSNTFGVGPNYEPITSAVILSTGKNQNLQTYLAMSNTTAGTSATTSLLVISDTAQCQVFVGSSLHSTAAYQNKIVVYGGGGCTGIALYNSVSGSTITFYTGASVLAGTFTSSQTLTLVNPLGVASGGIGVATLAANGVLYGNTTSAVQATAAGTTSQVLIGGTGPSFTSTLPATVQGNITTVGTLSAGTVPASLVTGAINGSFPAAGKIGEQITAQITRGSPHSLTSGTIDNLTSITLTAGNWAIYSSVGFINAAAMTYVLGGVSTSSGGTPGVTGGFEISTVGSGVISDTINSGATMFVSITTNTIYYLNCTAGFTGSCSGYGIITGIRIS